MALLFLNNNFSFFFVLFFFTCWLKYSQTIVWTHQLNFCELFLYCGTSSYLAHVPNPMQPNVSALVQIPSLILDGSLSILLLDLFLEHTLVPLVTAVMTAALRNRSISNIGVHSFLCILGLASFSWSRACCVGVDTWPSWIRCVGVEPLDSTVVDPAWPCFLHNYFP